MIFKQLVRATILALTTLLLSACPGEDDNKASEGLKIHIAEVHLAQRLAESALLQQSIEVSSTAATNITGNDPALLPIGNSGIAGYDRLNLEHHDVTDGVGRLLSLFKAYLVVDEIILEPCASFSQIPQYFLNSIFPRAEAHAGHGAEPVGGRSLDLPNVIDIVTIDEYTLALGDLAVAPGDYCGVRVNLSRLSGRAYARPPITIASIDDPVSVPGVPDLNGKFFVIRADYCAIPDGTGGCAQRVRVDVDDGDLALPNFIRIQLSSPVKVSEDIKESFVSIGIAYGEWFNDIDASIISSDTLERQKLLNNIVGSFHIYAKGFGDLPTNIL